ncbi:hypothetical protein Tco_0600900 [Tanacetum coccineum]
MSTLKYAETHNLVVFLEKPKESVGFEGIIDFLNASSIRYALTIQALVDGKKVIVIETSVRRALHLKDAEGTDCLPTATIFAELERISTKTTTWNEFSSTMASTIICLATNQKYNFSKYIFDNMVKNLEGGVKFLMYPRFVQVFLDKQVKGMSKYKETYATPSHTKKVFANMKREGKGFSGRDTPLFPKMMKQKPRRKQRRGIEIPSSSGEPIAYEVAIEENKPTHSNDSILSGEDRLQLNELMKICTNLQKKVLDLETSKAAQAQEISSLKQRVKKLEKKKKSRPHGLRRLYKVGSSRRVESFEGSLGAQEDASKQGRKIADLDADAEVTLIDETQGRNDEDLMFDTGVLDGDEVFEEPMVNAATTTSSILVSVADPVTTAGEVVTTASVEIPDELTLAQTLIEIKSAKPKAVTTAATTVTPATIKPRGKGIIFHDQEEQVSTPTLIVSPSQSSQVKDKGKAKMIEEEPVKKFSKKEQIRLDEEFAFKIQAEEQEEERIAREKAQKIQEANIAWDDIQATVEADYQLAQRLHDEEQEQYTDEEKAKFFCEFLEQRRKFFAAKRAEAKRNKPPTQAQQRKLYSFKRVNTFVAYKTELQEESSKKAEAEMIKESSSKRAGTEIEQEVAKKQKIDDDQEEAEMKKHMEIVLDEEEIEIDAIPLATKPPIIVEWKIIKEGKMGYYQLIRADGSSKRYSSMIQMLQNIDKEDLEILWKLVKAKHGNTRPEEGYERVLWGDLKVMFEPDVESEVWRSLDGYNVIVWKLFDSCGVHFVRFKNLHIFMLVEKKYSLTPAIITGMLNKKLQVDQWNEMSYQLLKLMVKQQKNPGSV